MNSGECYEAYCALKAHFRTWGYDYHTYKGKVTGVDREAFDARRERSFFERLARQYDPFGILLAHISETPSIWIGNIDPNGEVYLKQRANLERLTDHVCEQVDLLKENFNNNFIVEPGRHPRLIKLLLGGVISLQTAAILVELTNCGPYWKRLSTDDSFFTEECRRIIKYAQFLDYDQDEMRKGIQDRLLTMT